MLNVNTFKPVMSFKGNKNDSVHNNNPIGLKPLKQDTVSFKAVTPKLEKVLTKDPLMDNAKLRGLFRDKIISLTDENAQDNIKRLAQEWHNRKTFLPKFNIKEAMKDFWNIDVEKVKID